MVANTRTERPSLSVTEWVVLGLLAEQPRHGFAIAKELVGGSDLGQIIAVHRPVVYRALARLVTAGWAEVGETERGEAGPNRTVNQATAAGISSLDTWLDQPVEHVRDLRIEFLVKIRLNQRRSRSTQALIATQQTVFAPMLEGIAASSDDHIADRWRRHNARAAQTFLDELSGT